MLSASGSHADSVYGPSGPGNAPEGLREPIGIYAAPRRGHKGIRRADTITVSGAGVVQYWTPAPGGVKSPSDFAVQHFIARPVSNKV
jgi:hypothetical protein